MERATLTITNGGMVMIPVCEYEELVRDSERLAVVTDYVKQTEYICKDDLRIILSVVKEQKGEENGTEN